MEAVETDSPEKIRTCFAIMISCCQLSDPVALGEKNKEAMTEDILYEVRRIDNSLNYLPIMFNKTLLLIENKVNDMTGRNLSYFGMASPNREEEN